MIEYGISRGEFKQIDTNSIFDLIVFSYQEVRMYSWLMPVSKETPGRILKQIKQLLLKTEDTSMVSSDKLQLVKPTLSLKNEALNYRQEHFDYEEYVINGSELFDKIQSYEEWLEKVTANSKSETVDPNWVLTDTFFVIRLSDSKIVGIVDLRYQLNDFLKDFGNCGYSVRPTERRKGYATEILKQICTLAKSQGLESLQLSVEKNNTASIKTIEKNGGTYLRSFVFDNEEAYIYIIGL